MSSPHLTRVILFSGIVVAAATLPLWPNLPGDRADQEPSPTLPPVVADATAPTPADQRSDHLSGDETSDSWDQDLARLQHPAVQDWLRQEAGKIALRDWFADPAGSQLTAGEAWKMIEQAESEGRVMAFEALHLKIAWLERESESRDEFERRSARLLAEYEERAEQRTAARSPGQVPGFSAYKEQERQIIDEVNALESIPGGLSRQAYLRERLMEARIDAYGQARSDEQ